jgi:cytochrome P450
MSEQNGSDVLALNPFEPGFFDNPYAQYAKLREARQVHESGFGPWLLMRYDDVLRLLRDPGLSVDERNAPPTLREELIASAAEGRDITRDTSMLNTDPPDHTRLRRLVHKAFTPQVLERMRNRVQELVDQACDEASERGEMDVIADLAFPLPFAVISEMLGMPDADRDLLRTWSSTLVKTLDPIISPEEIRAGFDAGELMAAHVQEAIAWKRENPADDLLSALVAAEEEGDKLSSQELTDQVMLLFIAGHETTVNLIGNGTLALLRHADQRAQLAEDRSLIANAIEELLRYDSPVQFSRRITLAEWEVGGVRIPSGSVVLAALGAANRDPARWGADSDTVNIRREGAGQHVSFGNGAHHCLGANLARLEGQVAIATMTSRYPEMSLSAEPDWNGRVTLRGLNTLPVRLGGRVRGRPAEQS